MMQEFPFIFLWWFLFFGVGLAFLPLTTKIFASFADRGYIFAKILGVAVLSYLVFLLGSLKILPFRQETVWLLLLFLAVLNYFAFLKSFFKKILTSVFSLTGDSYFTLKFPSFSWAIFAFEEVLFFLALFFWAWVRANEPSIHGLEKFMDFGFINSLLRSDLFPPKDLWLTPQTINYYYFGHLVTAVLTKLSGIPPEITFNLMLAALFGLTFTGAFSIGLNLFNFADKNQATGDTSGGPPRSARSVARTSRGGNEWQDPSPKKLFRVSVVAGFLSAFLVTLGGNLHTFYAFIRGFDKYWYPDATRFIPYTIHEFPSYSWVVSDLHGHVLDIPFVLLAIAILLSILLKATDHNTLSVQNSKFKVQNYSLKFKILETLSSKLKLLTFNFGLLTLLLAFLLAVMYMTNAWDGIIYFGLTSLVIFYLGWRRFSKNATSNNTNATNFPVKAGSASGGKYYKSIENEKLKIKNWSFIGNYWYLLVLIGIIFFGFLFSLPFTLHFKPFVFGVGLVRDRSPFYMLAILWGFFYFFTSSFIISLWRQKRSSSNISHPEFISGSLGMLKQVQHDNKKWVATDYFVLLMILLSTLLLIFPEVAYIKDIYPLHYRANTMFKLGYQAFIMLSLASAYIFMRIASGIKYQALSIKRKILYTLYIILSTLLFTPVAIYPYFAIKSYYNNLRTYKGLDGMLWLQKQYPQDFQAIQWLRTNIKGQPVILEAVGESYTDYARVSSFTGLPTVLGWPVHEWLWRGSYDEAGKRDAEVGIAYDTANLKRTKEFLEKYEVKYVFVGFLERQKYLTADFSKWEKLGKVVFRSGQTTIYQIPDF